MAGWRGGIRDWVSYIRGGLGWDMEKSNSILSPNGYMNMQLGGPCVLRYT